MAPLAHDQLVKIWRRKLKGRARGFLLGAMYGLALLHNAAGGPVLHNLPQAVEPIVGRDWDRHETEYSVEPADPDVNDAPGTTGNPGPNPQRQAFDAATHRRSWSGQHVIIANDRARGFGVPE